MSVNLANLLEAQYNHIKAIDCVVNVLIKVIIIKKKWFLYL